MFLSVLLVATIAAPVLVAPEDDLAGALFVDARSSDAYAEGHLPGAITMPAGDLSENRNGVVGLLRPIDDVRATLAEHGVNPERHIVVYATASNLGDLTNATRLFWILEYLGYPEVSLLNGGVDAWKVANKALETTPVTVDAVSLSALNLPIRVDRKVTAEDVEEVVAHGGAQLLDSRSPEQYAGVNKNGEGKKTGHIPGAASAPASEAIDGNTFRFKPIEALAELAKAAGAEDSPRQITYCNTGRSATISYVLYRALGLDSVAVYDGSMSEWSTLDDAPLETEPAGK